MTPRIGLVTGVLALLLAVALIASACGSGGVPQPSFPPTPTPTGGRPAQAQPTPTPAPQTGQPAPGGGAGDPARGKQKAAECMACHSVDGSEGVGPTWKGLYGRMATLADGSTVQADEAYLRESICNPDAKVVKGFSPGVMPKGYCDRFSEQDLQDIIAYIKTLK